MNRANSILKLPLLGKVERNEGGSSEKLESRGRGGGGGRMVYGSVWEKKEEEEQEGGRMV